MIKRFGFVSNSSSTSSIIISKILNLDPRIIKLKNNNLIISGEYEFGWDFKTYKDFDSKAAFSYLQCKDDTKHLKLLNSVIKDYLKCSEIIWNIQDSYIDHQSIENNTFKFDYKFIKHFLFSNDSYLEMGNDND